MAEPTTSSESETLAELSAKEVMAIALSRRLGPGRAIVGAASAVPIAAVLLARQVRGIDLHWICSGTGFVDPQPRALYPSSTQFEYREGASSVLPYDQIATLFERGFDYAFFGGIEVDGTGRLNTTRSASGSMGPGPAGLPIGMARSRNVLVYMTRHNPKVLVDSVSHATGVPVGNVRAIVTPLADFTMTGGGPQLSHLLGDASLEEVRSQTGFLFTADEPMGLLEPEPAEVAALRAIDTSGYLRE